MRRKWPSYACGHHKVVWLFLLQHHPHHFDVVARMAPVALGVQVTQHDLRFWADDRLEISMKKKKNLHYGTRLG